MSWPGYENYRPGVIGSDGRVKAETPSEDDAISFQCRALKLPEPVREYRFAAELGRKWAFDWAWPDRLVALEKEGVVYPAKGSGDHRLGGRHASVKGFQGDIEKYGTAFSMGWRVLRCLPEQVNSGQAMLWMEPILRG